MPCQVIRSCRQSAGNDLILKETAVRFWIRATDDLNDLRSIQQNQTGFEQALWIRAVLGDLSAVPLVKEKLEENRNWFRVVHHIWSEQFHDMLDVALLELRNSTPIDYSGGKTNA